MRLEFHGAAGTVTGSHHVLDTGRARLGIDAGLFQGGSEMEQRNRGDFGHRVGSLDALLLTHAHIDHSGRVPLLAKQGFRGPVLATEATADLCDLMLRDCAHLMDEATRYDPRPPLYTEEEAVSAVKRFRAQAYGRAVEVAGAEVTFRDAGHILGSAILEVSAGGKVVVFSGDLGRPGAPLLRDPERVAGADALVLESTYGDREHGTRAGRGKELFDIVRETVGAGGNVIIPAFSVGRTQEVLHELNPHVEAGRLRGVKCFVDSPMSISATEIYRRHPECFDAETLALLSRGDSPFDFPGIRLTRTRDQSKQINTLREPHIVLSANGMCTGGRILHHLARNIERRESTILFVGYQAEGTAGRQIQERRGPVRLFGKRFDIGARVETLDAFSAHADRSELLGWLGGFRRPPPKVFLVHGEGPAASSLAGAVKASTGAEVFIPRAGDAFDI